MTLKEGLELIKFHYKGKNSHIKIPSVKLLDPEYPGIKGQKNYGKRKDLLGWSLSHVINKKEAIKAIDDISDFTSLLSNSSKDAYTRIKEFYPEQSKFLRRFMRDGIKGLKRKEPNGLWKNVGFDDLIKFKDY